MSDDKPEKVDVKIAALQEALDNRKKELADPKRQKIRALYGELERILDQLEELGEDVSDGERYVVYVAGTLFSYMHGDGLQEK